MQGPPVKIGLRRFGENFPIELIRVIQQCLETYIISLSILTQVASFRPCREGGGDRQEAATVAQSLFSLIEAAAAGAA